MTQPQRRRIPEAAVNRLPVYLQILNNLHATSVLRFSSDELAVLAGVNAAKVRKDLSYLGSYGTRGVGYEVTYLIHQIKRELGLLREWNVVVVGAGNLGCALAKFGGFAPRGFPVVGIVDNDPKKIGQSTGSLTIGDVRNLGKIVRDLNVTIGAITTSTATAQSAVDALIDAGVASILNFAPIVLATPSSVSVRNVDLGVELQILSYYEQMRTEKIESANTAKAPSSVSV